MKIPEIALTLVFLLSSLAANAEEIITLKTRPGVEQTFMLSRPHLPAASVILFAGGKGTLNLSSSSGSPSINWGKNNFLVRSRDMFSKNGFIVSVIDAPSDRKSKTGMLGGFRNSMDHVEDIDHVISYLRDQADIPVWLIGTSRGTESAANLAINSRQKPNGLILTSSMSVQNRKGVAVSEMELDRITVPTLIAAHIDDGCNKTPPEGARKIARLLSNAKKVEIKRFSGGDTPISKPCQALSYHGFLGIENKVVDYISDFIKAN